MGTCLVLTSGAGGDGWLVLFCEGTEDEGLCILDADVVALNGGCALRVGAVGRAALTRVESVLTVPILDERDVRITLGRGGTWVLPDDEVQIAEPGSGPLSVRGLEFGLALVGTGEGCVTVSGTVSVMNVSTSRDLITLSSVRWEWSKERVVVGWVDTFEEAEAKAALPPGRAAPLRRLLPSRPPLASSGEPVASSTVRFFNVLPEADDIRRGRLRRRVKSRSSEKFPSGVN